MRILTMLALFLVTACSTRIYDEASDSGVLGGAVLVFWVGPGSDTSGDGRFVFLTPPDDPLKFIRPAGQAALQPGMIYTDGGSIPRLLQPFKGLNPWGYAPAYMIHDWLFVARRCLNDGEATPNEQSIAPLSFDDSATIMAEVIKAMIRQKIVRPGDVAPQRITWAVQSRISQQRWAATGECLSHDRISQDHLDQIEAALPGVTAGRGRGIDDKGRRVAPAKLVGSFKF